MKNAQHRHPLCDHTNKGDVTTNRNCPDIRSKFRAGLSAFGEVAQYRNAIEYPVADTSRCAWVFAGNPANNSFQIPQRCAAEYEFGHLLLPRLLDHRVEAPHCLFERKFAAFWVSLFDHAAHSSRIDV